MTYRLIPLFSEESSITPQEPSLLLGRLVPMQHGPIEEQDTIILMVPLGEHTLHQKLKQSAQVGPIP